MHKIQKLFYIRFHELLTDCHSVFESNSPEIKPQGILQSQYKLKDSLIDTQPKQMHSVHHLVSLLSPSLGKTAVLRHFLSALS